MSFFIVEGKILREILWVIYAISLGTFGNILYRINNNLTDFHYRHKRARPLRIRT